MAPSAKPSGGKAQPTLSSYFSQSTSKMNTPKKRANTTIDLTLDSEDEGSPPHTPAPKRAKLGAGPSSYSQTQDILRSPVAKYQYQKSPEKTVPGTQQDEDISEGERLARLARRTALRQKLGDHLIQPSKDLKIAEDGPSYDLGNEEEERVVEPDDPAEEQQKVQGSLGSMKRHAHKGAKKSRAKADLPSESKGRRRAKDPEETGPSGQKYTPLEKQVLQMKKEHADCLLLFEVGYKYRFFGEDAQIASKELGIACFPDRNFLTASIPVHRRNVHVKKLISQGHKVGIIGQTETAALKKAGDNRSAPFERRLTNMYTAATFVDELDSVDETSSRPTAHSLLCLVESLAGGMGADGRVVIGMVAVVPSTGEVTYDEWDDSHMRTELETRITHIRPSEIILPVKSLSKPTEKMIEHYSGNKRFTAGVNIRVERFGEQMDFNDAFDFVSDFYQKQNIVGDSSAAAKSKRTGQLLAKVVDFPKKVVIALAHAMRHLASFGVSESLLEATFFTSFAHRSHMLLMGSTLTNLEIYRNNTDFSEIGSLFWVLDNTKTKFGSRLLKSWIGKPLVDRSILQERIDAVQEILDEPPPAFDKICSSMKGLPDLVKGLARVVYGKATPKEVAALLAAFQRIGNAFEDDMIDDTEQLFKSPLWNDIAQSLPKLRQPVDNLLKIINVSKARFDSTKADLWIDEDKYPALEECKFSIMAVESDLEDELKSIRRQLKRPGLKWTSVSGEEYLVEVRNSESKTIPANWIRVSATKQVIRFHTPEVKKKIAEREQYKEQLDLEAESAWLSFLKEWAEQYAVFRDVTSKLAIADCLISLSVVAAQPGYSRPQFVDEDNLEIIQGRHPMVEVIRSDPFVPNTISIGGPDTRTKIITGPNMGGKSTCCRAVALITVMAQIGSYVPATSATLSVHDAILTRMGAADELARGRSTFMVEMQETSDIMKIATSRSLLILDELGRGTSTHDGQAIASAVLQHLVENVKPKVLFITHYPLLAAEFADQYDDVANLHAGFVERTKPDGGKTLDFLYRLSPGIAQSYGVECARLAGLPEPILQKAAAQSSQLSVQVEQRVTMRRFATLLRSSLDPSRGLEARTARLNDLRLLLPNK